MAPTTAVKPNVTLYGSTIGTSDDHKITSYEPAGDILRAQEEDGYITSLEEFNDFYRSVHDFVVSRLGYPTIRVELTPNQIKTCIDEATSRLSYHAPSWTRQYAVFDASANCNLYELPRYIAENISYVVYKKSLLTIQSMSDSLEFDFFIKFFQGNYLFSDFSVGEFYMLQSRMEQMRKILSQEGTWEIINGKYLQLYPRPVVTPQEVIVEYRALDSDTLHPAYKMWIKRFALACSKEVLGEVRGKFKTLPGPGGATLNGEELISRAREDKDKLIEELLSEIEEPPVFTMW